MIVKYATWIGAYVGIGIGLTFHNRVIDSCKPWYTRWLLRLFCIAFWLPVSILAILSLFVGPIRRWMERHNPRIDNPSEESKTK